MWRITGRGIRLVLAPGVARRGGWRDRPGPDAPRASANLNGDGGPYSDEVVRWYRFGRSGDLRDAELVLDFRDRSAALSFLSRFRDDGLSLATLRDVLAAATPVGLNHRLCDHEVLDQLAVRLVGRSVTVAVEFGKRTKSVSAASQSASLRLR